jgi:hypothetical protein
MDFGKFNCIIAWHPQGHGSPIAVNPSRLDDHLEFFGILEWIDVQSRNRLFLGRSPVKKVVAVSK